MATPHFDQLSALISQVASGRFKNVRLECRHFFSGAAVYANGRICMSLTPVGFAIKLPQESRNALLKQGGKHLRYFAKGPIKKDYVILPRPILKEMKILRHWMRVSIDYVLALPEPGKRKRMN